MRIVISANWVTIFVDKTSAPKVQIIGNEKATLK